MAKAIIDAGICGFKTEVVATSDDMETVNLLIQSECPNFKNLQNELGEVDGIGVTFAKIGTGEVFETCRKTCPHAACPVPTGIIKAVEVAAGLALPKDCSISLSK